MSAFSWTPRSSPVDGLGQGYGIAKAGSRLIVATTAFGSSKAILTSDDGGATWVGRSSPFDNFAAAVAYSPSLGVVVAVGTDNTSTVVIAHSSDLGNTWTGAGNPCAASFMPCVAWDASQGLFVAGASNGTNQIATSPDGVNWTPRATPWDGSGLWGGVVNGVCYAAGSINKWVAVGFNQAGTKTAMTASDPTSTWTNVASGPFDGQSSSYQAVGQGQAVTWDGTRLIATSYSGTKAISTSSDGAAWIGRSSGLDGVPGYGLSAYGSYVLCGGEKGIFTSSDGGSSWVSNPSNPFTTTGAPVSGYGCFGVLASSDTAAVAVGVDAAFTIAVATGVTGPQPDTEKLGICIAFGYGWNDLNAVFTRIDDPNAPGLAWDGAATRSVVSWSTDRGRAYEIEKTQAGTATIVLKDTSGIFDPTNADGPLYGLIVPTMQAKINVLNPNTRTYHDIFTGFVESWEWTMDKAEKIMTVTIGLTDGFEPLTRGELQPEANGSTTFVADSASTACQTRLHALADLAGWPDDGLPATDSSWRKFNTGNVKLKRTIYNAQTSFLSAMQDVADAEFPSVANIFANKKGALTFYGRYPRFQPSNYPDDVQFWKASDIPGLAPAGSAALISDMTWALDSTNLINGSLSFTADTAQADMLGQLVTDAASIAKYGVRTKSFPDLIVDGQNAGGGVSPQPAATANEVCRFYSQYLVDNYAQPKLRISRLEFTARLASDAATWALLTGVEIGDLLTIFTTNPGGGGFGKETDDQGVVSQFFVEGIHNVVAGQLANNTLNWTMTLDVSPRDWFRIAPFGS